MTFSPESLNYPATSSETTYKTETNPPRETMRPLTLNQAAKAAHKSKAAILEAIRSGRLSAARDDLNQWQIEPSELFRVYPPDQVQTGDENHDQPQEENHKTTLLSAQISHLEQQLETQLKSAERERRQLESTIDDLRTDRDHWRQQATALLTHQPDPEPNQNPEPPPAKSGERSDVFLKAWNAFMLTVAGVFVVLVIWLTVAHWLGWV